MDIEKAIKYLDLLEENINIMKKNEAMPIPYEDLGEDLDNLLVSVKCAQKCLVTYPELYGDSNERNSKYKEYIPLMVEVYLKNKKNFHSTLMEIHGEHIIPISDKQLRNILEDEGLYVRTPREKKEKEKKKSKQK